MSAAIASATLASSMLESLVLEASAPSTASLAPSCVVAVHATITPPPTSTLQRYRARLTKAPTLRA